MPTRYPLLAEWQQRIAELNRLIEAGGPSVWLYEIRVKILEYFISRYGHQSFPKNEVARSHSDRGEKKAYFAVDTSRWCGATPKTPETIRLLLQNIHRTV